MGLIYAKYVGYRHIRNYGRVGFECPFVGPPVSNRNRDAPMLIPFFDQCWSAYVYQFEHHQSKVLSEFWPKVVEVSVYFGCQYFSLSALGGYSKKRVAASPILGIFLEPFCSCSADIVEGASLDALPVVLFDDNSKTSLRLLWRPNSEFFNQDVVGCRYVGKQPRCQRRMFDVRCDRKMLFE